MSEVEWPDPPHAFHPLRPRAIARKPTSCASFGMSGMMIVLKNRFPKTPSAAPDATPPDSGS
ncbi:MAG: hypothetical protein ACOYOU_16860 [Kiritimatiellia bacterium]